MTERRKWGRGRPSPRPSVSERSGANIRLPYLFSQQSVILAVLSSVSASSLGASYPVSPGTSAPASPSLKQSHYSLVSVLTISSTPLS